MNFRRIDDFSTDPGEGAKLGRELSQLEDNIAAAIDAAQKSSAPLLACVDFTATADRPITFLPPDAQLNLDTSQVSGAAVLPALAPANFGRRFVLIKPTAANFVFVSCRDKSVKFNAGTFPTLSAAGVTVFYCNKYGYFS